MAARERRTTQASEIERPVSEPRSGDEEKALQSITGNVLDASGAAVPNANVSASLELSPDVPNKRLVRQDVDADASGHFVFNRLPRGSYKLNVKASGFFDGHMERATLK